MGPVGLEPTTHGLLKRAIAVQSIGGEGQRERCVEGESRWIRLEPRSAATHAAFSEPLPARLWVPALATLALILVILLPPEALAAKFMSVIFLAIAPAAVGLALVADAVVFVLTFTLFARHRQDDRLLPRPRGHRARSVVRPLGDVQGDLAFHEGDRLHRHAFGEEGDGTPWGRENLVMYFVADDLDARFESISAEAPIPHPIREVPHGERLTLDGDSPA